jgi:hypothetical protein
MVTVLRSFCDFIFQTPISLIINFQITCALHLVLCQVELNLSNHRLTTLADVEWSLLPSLTRLDCSYNVLAVLEGVEAIPALRELVLNNNAMYVGQNHCYIMIF